jgi:predicted hydrolase (HD superfamily)
MLNREEALQLVKEHIQNNSLLKHVLAVEAIMKECAKFLEKTKINGL